MALDADMQCVELANTLQFDNEGKRTWKSFNEFTKASIFGWDEEEQIDITDMHKSHAEVYSLLALRSFYDKFHLTKNVAERHGKTGKDAFLNAWHATSLDELEEAKRAFTPALAKYLGRFSDPEIYPAACPDLGKRLLGSAVEGLNGGNRRVGVRDFHPAHWLREIMELMTKRVVENKRRAIACVASGQPLPPKGMQAGHDERQHGNAIPSQDVVISEDRKTCTVRDGKGTHNVDIDKLKMMNPALACPCGLGLLSGVMCRHSIAAAKAMCVRFESLLPVYDTTAGYAQQYAAVVDHASHLPSAADIEAHSDLAKTNLAFVPWFKDPVGRPKKDKRIQSALEQSTKKKKEARKDAPNVGQRHAMVLIGRSTIKKYALSSKKKRIDEHLAIDEHWAGLDARTLGRSDARTRGRVRVRALGCYINPKDASS